MTQEQSIRLKPVRNALTDSLYLAQISKESDNELSNCLEISQYWISFALSREQDLEAQRIRADKAEEEAKHQESRAKRYCNDYHEACRFQLEYGRQAELAEQERDKLIKLVDTLDKAVNEDDESEWDYFATLIRKEITAYREGSNTDAKRD